MPLIHAVYVSGGFFSHSLFVIGSALVIVSTVLYGLPGRPAGGGKQSLL